ncbi:hypothetical protein TNCV_1918711 [Trichonephila clavipes]|nr:hypothetical protein TNCV_1918711 [Trichonephila clavipes]
MKKQFPVEFRECHPDEWPNINSPLELFERLEEFEENVKDKFPTREKTEEKNTRVWLEDKAAQMDKKLVKESKFQRGEASQN